MKRWLTPDSRILDLGCGYGRTLGQLSEAGYRNLIGLDPAAAMVRAAQQRLFHIQFAELESPAKLPLEDSSVDAVLLFSVLTCIPTDDGQRKLINEVSRVLNPEGLLYISDLWLQTDARNVERYKRDQEKYGTYGVFDLPEGVTVRHHSREWIASLTEDFRNVALDEIEVVTMNGNPAKAFQWFGLKSRS